MAGRRQSCLLETVPARPQCQPFLAAARRAQAGSRSRRPLAPTAAQQKKSAANDPLSVYRQAGGRLPRSLGWQFAQACSSAAARRCRSPPDSSLATPAAPNTTPRDCRPPSREGASLRAEAEAPFRSLRLFIFGGGAASATLATLFSLPPLIGALGGAAGATKSVADALQDVGINVASMSVLAFFVYRDLQARECGASLGVWPGRVWLPHCCVCASPHQSPKRLPASASQQGPQPRQPLSHSTTTPTHTCLPAGA